MITIQNHSHLTEKEMANLANTELYADLMRHKYRITTASEVELKALLNRVNHEVQFAWYFERDAQVKSSSGFIYFSMPVDSETIGRIVDEDRTEIKT